MTSFVDDNGNYLQYSGADFGITRQVASFRNFKIKGDVSLSFDLQDTSVNRAALGYYGIGQVNSPAFSQIPFNLLKNGNQAMRGFIVIEGQDSRTKTIKCFFVSGNSNWFKSLDFNCNEIVNSFWSVQWNISQIAARSSATAGITFPFIDWVYMRQKFNGNYTVSVRGVGDSLGSISGTDNLFQEVYPCLYVHTMIDEIANKAGIAISGSLTQDALYQSLIVTPAGPDLIDPVTKLTLATYASTSTSGGDTITIGSIAPAIKAIDMIKWLCFSFGCIPTFDEGSQTLSLDILDKIKKEDAVDWSGYLSDSNVQYIKMLENNYLKVKEPTETEIKLDYNLVNTLPYGSANILTPKTDGSSQDVYTSPFAPVKDALGTTPFALATPYIGFGVLEDDAVLTYTSVGGTVAGLAYFSGTQIASWVSDNGSELNTLIIRIQDDNNFYNGYQVTSGTGPLGTGIAIWAAQNPISTSTGTIYIQKLKRNTPGNRILSCAPSFATSDFSSQATFTLVPQAPAVTVVAASVAYAFFSKPVYPYANLNHYRKGLSYGEINLLHYFDTTLLESYGKTITKIMSGPTIQVYLKIPESEFIRFDQKTFVYLNTLRLRGYFLCEVITEYKDGDTEVRCDFLPLD